MGDPKTGRTRWRAAALTGALLFLAACSSVGPQDTLFPEGPVARQSDRLFKPVFWIAAVVFFLVEGALLAIVVRYRRRSDADVPVQLHGNKRLEIIWTIIPAALLGAISIPVVATIFDQDRVPVGGNVLPVHVTAHQWWWNYHYDSFTPAFDTANELVIPVGRAVALTLTSDDVIHSFWVPKLAGKQDVVPGRENHLSLLAEKPGTYFGQCAEFCALSHANMRLRVVAKPESEFAAWVAGQQAAAGAPSGLAAQGREIFAKGQCIACHTLRGIEGATGRVGPDLTHLASRETFAGATYDLNAQNLTAWLDDPPAQKPGSRMPDLGLSPEEIRALVAFLLSLT